MFLVLGLYSLGYVVGARAQHPNSPWFMAGLTLLMAWVTLTVNLLLPIQAEAEGPEPITRESRDV